MNTQKSLKETLESQYAWCAHCEEDIGKLLRGYVERKSQYRVLDFDDLLLYWHAMMSEDRIAKSVSRAFRSRAGRRIPGHEQAAGRHPPCAEARRPGRHRRRRRRAGYLLVPRRRGREHPRFPRPLPARRPKSSRSRRTSARARACSMRPMRSWRMRRASTASTCCRCAARARVPKLVTVDDLPTQAEFICTRVLASREAGIPLRAPGRAVPHRHAQRRARNRAREAQDSVS